MSLKTYIDGCFDAVGEKGVDVTGIIRSELPDAIRAIAAVDGFEKTPELRQYTNIEKNFRSDALFTARLMIIPEETLPTVSVSVVGCNQINWGDGTGWQTISQSDQILNHTYTSFDSPVVIEAILTVSSTIGGYACMRLMKPANVGTTRIYCPKFLWAVYKSDTIKLRNGSFQIPIFSTLNNAHFRRLYINCPATDSLRYLTIGQVRADYHVPLLVYGNNLVLSGGTGVVEFTGLVGDWRGPVNIGIGNYTTLLEGPGSPDFTVTGTANIRMSSGAFARNCPFPINRIDITANSLTGSWAGTFLNCQVEIIDLSKSKNAITDFGGNGGMTRLKSLKFPSVFADGFSSMGPIDINNSGLDRAGLVETFNSLPTNAVVANLTITNSAGAGDLTAEDIAIATGKNWIVIR